MSTEKQKTPDILCPFYEQECPMGERTASICWRRLFSEEAIIIDFEELEPDCQIAEWMFSEGGSRPHK